MDRIFVCSELDREKIEERYKCRQVSILPNVYPLPEDTGHIPGTGKFRLLFVGRLRYEPNGDAVFSLCDQVLPLLRKAAESRFELRIIGDVDALSEPVRKLVAQQPEIVMPGVVDDVAPYYREADAALVPLRAGSGTRIKVLEAFAFRVPVVSTSKGVEGLEVEHGEHVLIADTPQDFADQCFRLMIDAALREKLTRNGRLLVETKYGIENIRTVLNS